eukprot:TRINITY_DN612_c0_g1_i3.p1 TRINITY_DN612_c0_g1~~TRINITY_DN612_c0_g1_i3.p1  ORF type:complete len:588 (+),score=169.78 TRINITY_DN612_c0_g1_i3:129-1892(+)
MDRLRKSIRSSLRKKNKDQVPSSQASSQQESGGGNSATSKGNVWQQDEVAVRDGTCSFQVKYLGCVEVFESRGMQVCEEAVKVLKSSKRKSVRSILYIHGDGLRVVDDETKGLIVDQTIEKVSFCSPDRNFYRGFSYICRDGTTRRWMCHGFMAMKDSGERLSHAVGCAFAICLERKQKRDKECTVSMSFDDKHSSFTRLGSFRTPSITDRLSDPQSSKPGAPAIPAATGAGNSLLEANPHAIARPHATDLMLQRQTSFKGFNQLAGNSPFKRQLSLRINELPSTIERQRLNVTHPAALGAANQSPVNSIQEEVSNTCDEKNQEGTHHDPVSSMCQQLSQNLSLLSSSANETPLNPSYSTNQQPQSLPFTISSGSPLPTVPEYSVIEVSSSRGVSPLVQPPVRAAAIPVHYDNPWDNVPDQPKSLTSIHQQNPLFNVNNNNNNNLLNNNNNNINHNNVFVVNNSSGSMIPPPLLCNTSPPSSNDESSSGFSTVTTTAEESWAQVGAKSSHTPFISTEEIWSTKSSILDDPFDAEWAALATKRNNSKNLLGGSDSYSSTASSPTNPFRQNNNNNNSNPSIKTAFELQM